MTNYYDLGWDLAFKLAGDDLTPELGELRPSIIEQAELINETTGERYQYTNETVYPLTLCGDDGFHYDDKEEMEKKGIPTYYCIPNKTELSVGGDRKSVV